MPDPPERKPYPLVDMKGISTILFNETEYGRVQPCEEGDIAGVFSSAV
jgi:hypothetical protein